MTRYVALLGRINVGKNQLKMADLRAAMADAGFANVATVAASGNLVFDHAKAADAKLGEAIATVIVESFGIDTFAVVRSKAELEAAIDESPFSDGTDNTVHILFLDGQPGKAAFDKLIADHQGRGSERLAGGTKALRIDFVDGVGESKLTAPFMEKRLGQRGTARSIRSLKRILEKMG